MHDIVGTSTLFDTEERFTRGNTKLNFPLC